MWIDRLVFKECQKPYFRKFWVPQESVVVLGSSNLAEQEVRVENCLTDHVEVLKRSGGGGTVVLYPGCLIISLGAWVNKPFSNKLYFDKLNTAVLQTLSQFSEKFLRAEASGLSDLSYEGRKFAGTSLFRSREFLMYQASLIVECDFQQVDRYLKHPTKEPDYRKGRSHSDFLIGLNAIDSKAQVAALSAFFEENFDAHFNSLMKDELSPVNVEHVPYLLNRLV